MKNIFTNFKVLLLIGMVLIISLNQNVFAQGGNMVLPIIDSISSNQGYFGKVVVIYGRNLQNVTSVRFFNYLSNNAGIISPSYTSSDKLSFITPYFQTYGRLKIALSVEGNCPGGCNSNKIDFTSVQDNTIPTDPDLKINGSDGPFHISKNQWMSITWTSSNTSVCWINGFHEALDDDKVLIDNLPSNGTKNGYVKTLSDGTGEVSVKLTCYKKEDKKGVYDWVVINPINVRPTAVSGTQVVPVLPSPALAPVNQVQSQPPLRLRWNFNWNQGYNRSSNLNQNSNSSSSLRQNWRWGSSPNWKW